jgi:hypothetical protein
MNRAVKILLPLALLAALPNVAFANSVVPVIFSYTVSLFICNIALGIGEGLLLVLLFRWDIVSDIYRSMANGITSIRNELHGLFAKSDKTSQPRTPDPTCELVSVCSDPFPYRPSHPVHDVFDLLACLALMTAANFISAIIGSILLVYANSFFRTTLDINTCKQWLVGFVAVCYLCTLLSEWPFVALCLGKCKHRFRKSIVANVVVQTASYAVLIGGIISMGHVSLLTDVTVVALSQINMPNDIMLYHADSSEKIWAVDIAHNRKHIIGTMPEDETERRHRLTAEQSPTDKSRFDLVAKMYIFDNLYHKNLELKDTIILPGFAMTESAWAKGDRPQDSSGKANAEFWKAPQYIPSGEKNDWKFEVRRENYHGICLFINAKKHITRRMLLETPFFHWQPYCIAMLPNNQAVVKIHNQICLLDLDTQRIALLTKLPHPPYWTIITLAGKNKKTANPRQ